MTGLFKEHGRKLVENGYAIIPIPPGTKGPRTEGWQENYTSTVASFEDMAKDSPRCGVGIITKFTPAIDIDCLDDRITAHMRLYCHTNIGPAPERVGKAPKTLLLYAADKPFRKVMSARYYDPAHPERDPKRKGQRLEVLGDGQQFVAYHIHPETGLPYDWPQDWENPLEVPALDLTIITQADAEAACREFERVCEAAGWEKLGEGSTARDTGEHDPADALGELDKPDETDDEVARVKSALDAMSGDVASDYDYDQWRNVLFALKWTGWDCAEALALEWSESSDKHDRKQFNVVWRGAQKRDRGREVTLGSLFTMAKSAGWDASRAPSPEKQSASYEEIMVMVEALKDTDSVMAGVDAVLAKLAPIKLSEAAEGAILVAIKKHTPYRVADLRKDLAAKRKKIRKDDSNLATHGGYANAFVRELEDKAGVRPVGVSGMIYAYQESKGVWDGKITTEYDTLVEKMFDGQEKCERRSDYLAITQQAYSHLSHGKEDFFETAPVGLACKGLFYRVNAEGKIEKEELDHTHRQRVLSPVRPVVGPMPLFEKFLDDVFKGDPNDEQRELLQEVVGSVILGTMARYEKVVLLKGPGRSGKGTIMKIIEALVPREVRSAVSPFRWDEEYYLATLAGKRLNLVGELPEDDHIPAANFKSVVGRDLLLGRHPSGKPFQFRNEAAHIFNTNHFVYTKDHTEAFFTRWVLLEFRNSLIGKDTEIVTNLADQIISKELAAVMAWALQGAKRLEDRGHFRTTLVGQAMMDKWRHRTNTLIEFLLDTDACVLSSSRDWQTRRADFYADYVEWCRSSNRRPIGKHKLYDEIAENATIKNLGISFKHGKDGTIFVRGVRMKSEGWVIRPDEDDEL